MSTDPKSTMADVFEGRVLVVEDEEVNRLVARGIMMPLGIDPEFATNGAEAIEKTDAGDYDLILMDVQMPGMSGVEAAIQIRERERAEGRNRIPIAALTANATEGDRVRCMEAGMDGFMAKPLMRSVLIDTFTRWLGAQGTTSEQTGAVPPAQAGSILDGESLVALKASMGGGVASLRLVLESFQESLVRLPADISNAGQSGDVEAMVRAAHSLKSNSAVAGALDLSALCARLETKMRAGDTAMASSLILEIEKEVGRVKLALTTELDSIPK